MIRYVIGFLLILLPACATTLPPGTTGRGPQGTFAYPVLIESSVPGARIEVGHDTVGTTPMTLTIYGDDDGTFHNFGSNEHRITAYPTRPGHQPQTKVFRTGGWFGPEDRIPKRIFFDFGP